MLIYLQGSELNRKVVYVGKVPTRKQGQVYLPFFFLLRGFFPVCTKVRFKS